MSFFNDYIKKSGDKVLTKWAHYFSVYERELSGFRDTPIRFLEIGVFKGGSLPMWREYFAAGSELVFIDIDPACKAHEIEGTHVHIGDQSDPNFLASIVEKHGPFDVILDDGSHICHHQIASLEALWPTLSDNGLYLVEDCHTSYWPGFGGGYRNEASFIEYAKRIVDRMHSWYTDQDTIFSFDPIAKELDSVRFYDSIVVLEKRLKSSEPTSLWIQNGIAKGSTRALKIRGRTSIFVGKDNA